jgi:hypothetical protein
LGSGARFFTQTGTPAGCVRWVSRGGRDLYQWPWRAFSFIERNMRLAFSFD